MFNQELELIDELMRTYKEIRVKYELGLSYWLDGDYENLVPRIFLQMRAMRNFVGYLQFALDNGQYPDKMRIIGPHTGLEKHYAICDEDEYSPFFSDMGYTILKHLIEETEKFSVSRHNLRDGVWNESDYWNFQSLGSLMSTICLICEEELRDPYSYYEESEANSDGDEDVVCEWMYADDEFLYDDLTPARALPRWVTMAQIDSRNREGME